IWGCINIYSRYMVIVKLCSIIIDRSSNVNVASLRLAEKLNLLTLVHPRPYKFDRRLTHDGLTNRFSFEHMGHKVTFKPLSPRENEEERKEKEKDEKAKRNEINKRVKSKKEVSKRNVEIKETLMVSRKEVKRVLLAMKEPLFLFPTNIYFNVSSPMLNLPIEMIKGLKELFPKDIPHGLPPIRSTEHRIDFTMEATFPTRASYRASPTKKYEPICSSSYSSSKERLVMMPINAIMIRYRYPSHDSMIVLMNCMGLMSFLKFIKMAITKPGCEKEMNEE
ncbi:hypothetical protein CR513_49563, partial [Mucuna pruriens]